ncbi:hypothetical protein ABB37_00308 [Leptomonas pyrrhocoris]|uniref:Uncharacterized protein n=1 Tax=Leptomonas pyrrhocoris TaxID=157538 RepID=A0A0N0E051_LEPPY|nr:hypothetical protein ABB37_00308 [Leptomonas pyrrhocoris]KPA86035.1 hypothetical protein ABB37_00308 [Leptomonas pyrrhocoris]|eukprot:XP_015664474.1 hypothetical protein ABB37_00308 [Leptomonas pyrrhocoris]
MHSRGELLHEFFYAHRAALGLDSFYELPSSSTGGNGRQDADADQMAASAEAERASSPHLPVSFPVEVVYVRQSRKPYFLVEWRYPTEDEVKKQNTVDDGATPHKTEDSSAQEAAPPPSKSNASSSQNRLPTDFLAQLAERTLALGKGEESGRSLTWRDQPVTISAALAGMKVATERTKLELRDAQLKTQRVAEKRARDETEAEKKTQGSGAEAGKPAPYFVPRSVRRRA